MQIRKVAVDLDNLSKQLDPLSIPTLSDAFFVNHLYGNLVEFNEKRNITAALAKTFYWENTNTLVFEFDEKSPVNAADALFNLQRIIFNAKNLHGDIYDLICNPDEKIEDCLSRLKVDNGRLLISVANLKTKTLLLNTLASIDYKIIPLAAFDSNDFKTAKIKDYSITSGHYRLAAKNVFQRNKFSYLHFENDIESFEVIHSTSAKITDLVNSQDVDVVSTTIPLESSAIEHLKNKNFKLFETYPISIFFLSFSKQALADFTAVERFTAGNLILNQLGQATPYDSRKTEQFIQDFGQGYLTAEQASEIASLRKSATKFEHKPKRKIKLAVRNLERWKPFVDKNPEFELFKISGSVLSMPESERPDVFALTNDVSFETDFALLTFALKNNFLKLKELSYSEIISKFLSLEEDQRIPFINEVHYFSMKNCISFPMYASPYITLTADSLNANKLSKYNSRTLLWLLK